MFYAQALVSSINTPNIFVVLPNELSGQIEVEDSETKPVCHLVFSQLY